MDVVYGEAGNDFIWIFNGDGIRNGGGDNAFGGSGDDGIRLDEYGASTGSVVDGGAGWDYVDIKLGGHYNDDNTPNRTGYIVDLTNVWSGGIGFVGGSTITKIEAIKSIQGGRGDDSIIVGSGYTTQTNEPGHVGVAFNAYSGGEGNDYISGGSADETLNGDSGHDTLLGDYGNDNLFGGSGNDSLVGGTGNDAGSGGDGDDSFVGGVGNDTIYAQAGNDLLDGGAGNDVMDGGEGDDLYIVDTLFDTVADFSGTDTIKTGIDYALNLGSRISIENLILTGSASVNGTGNALANTLTGNSGANQLFGLEGQDTLSGGGGNDTLSGGMGADKLTGGSGADTFQFDVLESALNKDRITGFVHGEDKIAIDHLVFAAFAGDATGALDPAALGLGRTAKTQDQHLVYNVANGGLYYDEDGKGGADAVLIAQFTDRPVLDASDFLLI